MKQLLELLITEDGLRPRLIRAGLGSAGVLAASRVLVLVLGIILARSLGPDSYGIYAYVAAIMTLLMIPAEAGVPILLMREIAAAEAQGNSDFLFGALRQAMQFVAVTSITIALLGLAVLAIFSDRLDPAALYTTGLMLLSLPLFTQGKTMAYGLHGMDRIVMGQAIDMLLRPVLLIALMGTLFLFWPSLRTPDVAMGAQLLAALVVVIVAFSFLVRTKRQRTSLVAPATRGRAWLKSALPFTLVGGLGVLNSQTDIIMLGWFTDAGEVGVYYVATHGATLVVFGLQVVNTVLAPQFSRLHSQGDLSRLQRLVTQSAQIILLAALPIALTFVLAGAAIISYVFGAEFSGAYAPLAILATVQLVNAAFGSVGCLLNMSGHEAIVARVLWQTALLNIVLNAILIPWYGMIGAAIATGSAMIIWNVCLYRQIKQKLNIHSTALKLSI